MTTISRRGLLVFACTLSALTAPAFAQKGKPQPPPPPPPPVPVHYAIHYWQDPAGGTSYFNKMNNRSQAVGWYNAPDGTQHAWLYDPATNANRAIDLNDMVILGVPSGWVIRSATSINDLGAITGYVEPANDASLRQGYVLNMHPAATEANPLALPEMKVIPVPLDWIYSYGGDINSHGMVLGFIRQSGGLGVYLYQTALYGGGSDEMARDLGLSVYGADYIQISDTVPAMFAGELNDGTTYGTAFRYTDGAQQPLELFTNLKQPASVTDTGRNGDFCGSAFYSPPKGKGYTVPMRVLDDQVHLFSSWGTGSASAINARGDLLVWVNGPNLYWDAFGLFSLNSLVSGPAAELTAWKSAQNIGAFDINDPDINTGFGEVMGFITFSNGSKAYYTLTSVP